MTKTIRAAVVQLCSTTDVEHNLSLCTQLIARASSAGAQLVVLPENFCYIGSLQTKVGLAEDLERGGPILSAMQRAARDHRLHLVLGGMPTTADDPDKCRNTCVVLDPGGEVVARYDKIHMFDIAIDDGPQFTESAFVEAGKEPKLADLGVLQLGLSICYDLRFPELYRTLGQSGAQAVCVPAAFTTHTGKDHWLPLLRARAIENQVYVLAPGQYGRHSETRQSYGKSCIIDPWGMLVAQVSDSTGVAVAELDLDYLAAVRRQLPALQHKRL